jgi:hypothetical protein
VLTLPAVPHAFVAANIAEPKMPAVSQPLWILNWNIKKRECSKTVKNTIKQKKQYLSSKSKTTALQSTYL